RPLRSGPDQRRAMSEHVARRDCTSDGSSSPKINQTNIGAHTMPGPGKSGIFPGVADQVAPDRLRPGASVGCRPAAGARPPPEQAQISHAGFLNAPALYMGPVL